MRISPDERIELRRVGMNGNRQHVGRFVEDALGAVAVMNIDVENSHTLMLQPQVRGRDSAVVEKTESARLITIGMMSRRTTQRIG